MAKVNACLVKGRYRGSSVSADIYVATRSQVEELLTHNPTNGFEYHELAVSEVEIDPIGLINLNLNLGLSPASSGDILLCTYDGEVSEAEVRLEKSEFLSGDKHLIVDNSDRFKKIPDEGAGLIILAMKAGIFMSEIPAEELAKVVAIESHIELDVPGTEIIRRLVLTLDDGRKTGAYVVNSRDLFRFEIFRSRASAYGPFFNQVVAAKEHPWDSFDCWNCGAITSEPGRNGCSSCKPC